MGIIFPMGDLGEWLAAAGDSDERLAIVMR